MRLKEVGQLRCQVAQVLVEQCTIVADKMQSQVSQRVPASPGAVVDLRRELVASAKGAEFASKIYKMKQNRAVKRIVFTARL